MNLLGENMGKKIYIQPRFILEQISDIKSEVRENIAS